MSLPVIDNTPPPTPQDSTSLPLPRTVPSLGQHLSLTEPPPPGQCLPPPPPIRSTNGRFASYWNAFLFDATLDSSTQARDVSI